MPCPAINNLEAYLHEYLDGAGLANEPKAILFQTYSRATSLVGDGNEVAHIDLIIGPRGSAAETAFANALVNNKDGFHHTASR
jgi:Formaldehyde-activating enzyme (Fae)